MYYRTEQTIRVGSIAEFRGGDHDVEDFIECFVGSDRAIAPVLRDQFCWCCRSNSCTDQSVYRNTCNHIQETQ